MIQIREATSNDIPQIVELLKISLGEGLLKKSEMVWNFKHNQNPFGRSHVLVAIENNQFIGVRAFMKWEWRLGEQSFETYRAVDTATHPDHQGKGIFKKLTLNAIDDIANNRASFIFNTPNELSRPGYLKMGWQIVDKIKISVTPTLLYFYYILSFKPNFVHSITDEQLEVLCQKHNIKLSQKNIFYTPKSVAYLKWRYESNPMQSYFVFSKEKWYVSVYVKKHKKFNELRVVEVLTTSENDLAEIRKTIVRFAIQNKCWIITVAERDLFRLSVFGKFGPKLTFRKVVTEESIIEKALSIENWYYATGDLELF